MTLTITFSDDLAARLRSRAAQEQGTIDEVAEELLSQLLEPSARLAERLADEGGLH